MKVKHSFNLTLVAIAVAGALALYGCGGSSGRGDYVPAVDTATVTAPVVNTPLKDVTVTLTCADGTVGGSGTAADGSVSIAVPVSCLAPYTMAVSGKGTMAGPDLKFGTDDDEAYDSSTRTTLKSVIQATDLGLAAGTALTKGASLTAPSITSLTTMIAESVGTNLTKTNIDAAMAKVAGVTGLPTTSLYANPMTNGDVFKAATLVNEMVASAMKADPTKTPAGLIQFMATNTTAKLTDATIDTAKFMGMSAANDAILQAQMATMQAKAGAMKSIADAVAANVLSADKAGLTPADALRALNLALTSSQGNDAATEIGKAKMAQDSMKQMFEQMDKIAKDASSTGLSAADLSAKMAAMAQGLDAVRVQQESSIAASIKAAGGDATAIANAVKQASAMIIGSAPALLSSVTGAKAADLTSAFMSAAASSIAAQFDPTKMAVAVTAAGGDPTKIDYTSMGLNPATIASTAAATAAQASSLKLTPPSALASYPALAGQVVGMVINRATNKNYLASTKLQDWVNAIGTGLAKNSASLLNPDTVGATIGNYFFTSQPDLTTAPGDLTSVMTIGAAPTFTQSTTPITATPPAGTATPPAGTATPPAGTTTPPAETTTPPAGTTTPPAGTTTPPASGGGAPPAIDGAALYASRCSGCHSAAKKGKSVTAIGTAIATNVGGMGSLSSLTQAEIAAISAAP